MPFNRIARPRPYQIPASTILHVACYVVLAAASWADERSLIVGACYLALGALAARNHP